MMPTWKVPMPKAAPDAGHSHFAMAIKSADGRRLEFTGQIDTKVAAELFHRATQSAANTKPLTSGD